MAETESKKSTCWKSTKRDQHYDCLCLGSMGRIKARLGLGLLPPYNLVAKVMVRVGPGSCTPDICQIEEGNLSDADKVRSAYWQAEPAMQKASGGWAMAKVF